MSSAPAIILWCFTVATIGCSNLPRDPEHTTERVKHDRQIRVGLTEHPPWVIRTTGEPAGAEVELVRQFASRMGAAPVWIWGSEAQHMPALKRFELDLVIAGLDASTPWSRDIGVTKPYFEERVFVGVPKSMPVPATLKDLHVAVKSGDPAAAYLRERDAVPQRMPDLTSATGPVAAPEWHLRGKALVLTRFKLLTNKHVMAVPPGENGWLKLLEQFLFPRQSQVESLLQARGLTQ